MSLAVAACMDAHRGKAEFKVHSLNLDHSEPPVDKQSFFHQDTTTSYFIHYSTTWQSEINPTIETSKQNTVEMAIMDQVIMDQCDSESILALTKLVTYLNRPLLNNES